MEQYSYGSTDVVAVQDCGYQSLGSKYNIHADIHADIHTDIQTDIHTDIHKDIHTDIQTHRHTDIHTDCFKYRSGQQAVKVQPTIW